MMNAKELLVKAVESDRDGRILEAQNLYEEGIQLLMNAVNEEIDERKKKIYIERIRQYIDRSEQIKDRIQATISKGRLDSNVVIDEDSTGHSYPSLFGKYLNEEVKEILIEESYLQERYHFYNFNAFLELVVKKCPNLKYIRLVTKPDPKEGNNQKASLGTIKEDLSNRGISLSIKYVEKQHDRRILLSNGYVIKIGRGLHFFKPNHPQLSLGLHDFDFRKCQQTEVDIWHIGPYT